MTNFEEKPKQTVLTDEEREYLSAVIKPWRDDVAYIKKFRPQNSKFGEFIAIGTKDKDEATLPYFVIDTIYKGMEVNKEYTLEELGL